MPRFRKLPLTGRRACRRYRVFGYCTPVLLGHKHSAMLLHDGLHELVFDEGWAKRVGTMFQEEQHAVTMLVPKGVGIAWV